MLMSLEDSRVSSFKLRPLEVRFQELQLRLAPKIKNLICTIAQNTKIPTSNAYLLTHVRRGVVAVDKCKLDILET